jgi:uncharacterized protein with FMN-binding domain
MRRAILTIGGTAAGLAALLAFKTQPVGADAASMTSGSTPMATAGTGGGADGTGTGMSASPKASAKKKMMTMHGTGNATPSASSSSSSSSSGMAGGMSGGARTLTGAVANTMYGPMQVQVVLDGTEIAKVNILQHTDDGQMSAQVDAFALPKLTSETLTAQSARIDAVSGATYTSQGYIMSLQSALDQA